MSAPPVRGFIFDLDGTLVDSLGDIAAAMNVALAVFRYPTHDLDAYRDFVGEGVLQLVKRALPPDPVAQGQRAAVTAAYRQVYAEHMLRTTRPFPGVAELITALATRGARLGVLSNKPDAPTRAITEALFGAGVFAEIHGQKDGVPRKPDPTAALAIAEAFGLAAAEVAFVGDTGVDMETARAAGMRAVGVTWGFRPAELAAAGAEIIVDEAAALFSWLAGAWPGRPAG